MPKDETFQMFVEFTKVDEDNQMVYGYATSDALDSQDEVIEWDATADAIEDYSDWRTLKEMHKPETAAGTVPTLSMDEIGLFAGAEVVDSKAWEKCQKGVYKGFSIGGRVIEKEVKHDKLLGKDIGYIKAYKLDEISLVDRGANPDSNFSLAKIDRSAINFEEELNKAKITAFEKKRKQLGKTAGEFYAVPKEPPSNSKLPIFDASHVRNAMSRFDQTDFSDDKEETTAKRKILATAKKFDINVDEFKKRYGGVDMPKLKKKEDEVKEEVEEEVEDTTKSKGKEKTEKKEKPKEKADDKSPEEALAEKLGISVGDLTKALKPLTKVEDSNSDLEKKVSELQETVEKLAKAHEEIEKKEEVEERVAETISKAFSDKRLVEKIKKEDKAINMGEAFFDDGNWDQFGKPAEKEGKADDKGGDE